MTVFLVGGGSGGHITPILSVASEVKKLRPNMTVVYIGQKGDDMTSLVNGNSSIDHIENIDAGKFRRYYGTSKVRQLLDIKTLSLNARDMGRTVKGYNQARKLVGKYKPSVVFANGGFVGVPVGLAAARRKIPIITHDKDALPGLANRILSRYATIHAVSLPAEVYKQYDQSKTVSVGTPIASIYELITSRVRSDYRKRLDVLDDAKVVVATGGSLGAHRLNNAVADIAPQLLQDDKVIIFHLTGKSHFSEITARYDTMLNASQRQRVRVIPFSREMHLITGAADVVITRSGASTMAELATQGIATIIVPNPLLTGGHQLVNARVFEQKGAAVVVREDQMKETLLDEVMQVIDNKQKKAVLSANIHAFSHKHAAHDVAKLLITTTERQK